MRTDWRRTRQCVYVKAAAVVVVEEEGEGDDDDKELTGTTGIVVMGPEYSDGSGPPNTSMLPSLRPLPSSLLPPSCSTAADRRKENTGASMTPL